MTVRWKKTGDYDANGHIFSNQELRKILVPVVIEQVLTSMMGTADSLMVSNVSAAAISAVSLVDSLNVLIIQLLSAIAAGGTILCAHQIGAHNRERAGAAARQVLLLVTIISTALMAVCLLGNESLLRLIFGRVEQEVMEASRIYFFYTALSFPFLGIYNVGASVFRAQGNTRCPMTISVAANGLNIAGNAVLIFGLNMEIAGAAIATLGSRVISAAAVMWYLRNPSLAISIRNYLKIRPELRMAKQVLQIGIPSGVENSMFQFGKLAIQSSVSILGTTAIAAQAMTNILENMNGIAGIGIGIGMMTVVGQCMGAGRRDEAVYYIKKITLIGEIVLAASCLLVFAATKPVLMVAGMEKESADMCFYMMSWITLVKPLVWAMAFIPGYGMRAAGDVKYSMAVSTLSMWTCRVVLAVLLIRVFHFGPIAVWIGMFADWTIRGILFGLRFRSGKWAKLSGDLG